MAKTIFISYADRDIALRDELITHLKLLERQGHIIWHRGMLAPGSERKMQLMNHMKNSHIILLLISPDILATYECREEIDFALQREGLNQAHVIPILLRPTNWEHETFARLQVVPQDRSFITEKSKSKRDKAFATLVKEIMKSIQEQEIAHKRWNIPYHRNPLFTGREEVMTQLHDILHAGQVAELSQAPALSGLGGVGKTQIAVEYAYRYQNNYQAILWLQAESRDTQLASLAQIANVLQLPERDEQEQERIVEAVKRWLEQHSGWLLIFDNVEDMTITADFLPQHYRGHLIITTRTHAMLGRSQRIEIPKMGEEESIWFLLSRAGLLPPGMTDELITQELKDEARAIVAELGGLPLALDQAGAYIEETGCNLTRYLQLYRIKRQELLAYRGKKKDNGHPESVTVTFLLSFEKVVQINSAAAELLRFCAFLQPDDIPEEFIPNARQLLPPELQELAADPLLFDDAISDLLQYSLVQRLRRQQALSVHRLVQVVLRDDMDQETQQEWAKVAIKVVQTNLPHVEDVNKWGRFQRYLPQAYVSASLIEQFHLTFVETALLLNQTGSYLHQRGQYSEAERFLQQALDIREQTLGSEHSDTADALNNLAILYDDEGKLDLAVSLLQRAASIYENTLGLDHPDTAITMNNLALLYETQGQVDLAVPLLQRSLAVCERALGLDNPITATTLNNLAFLYDAQGKLDLALPLYQQALAIRERLLGPDHPETANTLSNLSALYEAQGKADLAVPLYERALAIQERVLGPDHPSTADTLNNLAALYHHQDKLEQAEFFYKRALALCERVLGADHPNTADTLNNLAVLYREQGKLDQAEPLYQRAFTIRDQVLGSNHPSTADSLDGLALLYNDQGRFAEAEQLFQLAFLIFLAAFGLEHPKTDAVLDSLIALYPPEEAEQRTAAFLEQALAPGKQISAPQTDET